MIWKEGSKNQQKPQSISMSTTYSSTRSCLNNDYVQSPTTSHSSLSMQQNSTDNCIQQLQNEFSSTQSTAKFVIEQQLVTISEMTTNNQQYQEHPQQMIVSNWTSAMLDISGSNGNSGVMVVDSLSGSDNSATNVTASTPSDPEFNRNLTVVIVYCLLFIVAAIGNLTVFISLFRSRRRKSRISLMITHLAAADLVVTFIMIPLEVGWRLTVQWVAGNVACKAFLFLRAFGLYLSSNVLVCVSLDRYFAVLHPLKVNVARRRGKMMLACAWCVSLLWSMPQSVVFHVSTHPKFPNFYQCVSFGFFSSAAQEAAYNLFCVMGMYFIPLFVIIITYTAIMCEIFNKSRDTKGSAENQQNTNGRMRLRRSDVSNIERARSRTLRMTITIVVVFVWCWTPYIVMTLWYTFDRESAARVPKWLQDALFMMAVSNSCMNPLVYGSYVMNFRQRFYRCVACLDCSNQQQTQLDINGTINAAVPPGQRDISRTFLKCVSTIRKVGSGATRSTAMCHGINRSSPPFRTRQPSILAKEAGSHRQLNNGFLGGMGGVGGNESCDSAMRHCACRTSFHSEPIGGVMVQYWGASSSRSLEAPYYESL